MESRWWLPLIAVVALGTSLVVISCYPPSGGPVADNPPTQGNDTVRHHQPDRMQHRRMHRHRHRRTRSRQPHETQGAHTDTTDLRPTDSDQSDSTSNLGRNVYQQYCSSCHGPNREGDPPSVPRLTDVGDRLSNQRVLDIINNGSGRMPPFNHLSETEKQALVKFLTNWSHVK